MAVPCVAVGWLLTFILSFCTLQFGQSSTDTFHRLLELCVVVVVGILLAIVLDLLFLNTYLQFLGAEGGRFRTTQSSGYYYPLKVK